MKNILITAFSICVLSGCPATGDRLSSRNEIHRFSKKNSYNKNNWFYCGTDSENHHFITRIGGNSLSFIVPKDQIRLDRIIDLPPSGAITLYQVYPDRDFQFGNDKFQWNYRK